MTTVTATSSSLPPRGMLRSAVIILLAVVLIEVLALQLWKIDFAVPFNYRGDTNWFLVPIKGILDNGWSYYVPQLSAPFGLSAVAFPSMNNLDWLFVKFIGLFTHRAGKALNLFWLFSVVLTAWSAAAAMHALGIQRRWYLPLCLLYAFLPFALQRNVAHISLVYYPVPLICLYAIHLANGGESPNGHHIARLGYLGMVAQAFNYIYFSFFALVLLSFAAFRGYSLHRSWRPVHAALRGMLLIVVLSAVNLAPSFYNWQTEGKPPNMEYKSAMEAEIFGLKIRKLLAPSEFNPVTPFKQWASREKQAKFPLENENVTARLGFAAATGLLLLLLFSTGIVRSPGSREQQALQGTAALLLFSLLTTTIGGFGALFNLLLADFRAYNRFSVYIAFLALTGLALYLQARTAIPGPLWRRRAWLGGFGVLALFSLYDQTLDARPTVLRRPLDEKAAQVEQQLVARLEQTLPPGSSVFQLPLTNFPADGGSARMGVYDHVHPYIWSKQLKWSWPSFSAQHQTWSNQLSQLRGRPLLEALVISGFSAIWIDRFGYADNAELVITELRSAGAPAFAQIVSERYAVLDLTPLVGELKAQYGALRFTQLQDVMLSAPVLTWDARISSIKHNSNGESYRWSQAQSALDIINRSARHWHGTLSFNVLSYHPGSLLVTGGQTQQSIMTSRSPSAVQIPLALTPGQRLNITFMGDMARYQRYLGDERPFHFSISDLRMEKTLSQPN